MYKDQTLSSAMFMHVKIFKDVEEVGEFPIIRIILVHFWFLINILKDISKHYWIHWWLWRWRYGNTTTKFNLSRMFFISSVWILFSKGLALHACALWSLFLIKMCHLNVWNVSQNWAILFSIYLVNKRNIVEMHISYWIIYVCFVYHVELPFLLCWFLSSSHSSPLPSILANSAKHGEESKEKKTRTERKMQWTAYI